MFVRAILSNSDLSDQLVPLDPNNLSDWPVPLDPNRFNSRCPQNCCIPITPYRIPNFFKGQHRLRMANKGPINPVLDHGILYRGIDTGFRCIILGKALTIGA
ncbi:hypothetical protein Nepgr_016705 [Nepenthes gracilis]|uniref:Uncharacterized protein n=1 Tax=Nepenthes gracilis TaxID=150966 RepID=A0AAD3XSD6_NEPGR|nr:hypothetical protein Nepgr_016705 [Nepenthes gracilis]